MNSITLFVGAGFEPVMATITCIQMSINSGMMLVAEKGNSKFHETLHSINDRRTIGSEHEKILRDPRFEDYVIGDMGRRFNLLAKIETRRKPPCANDNKQSTTIASALAHSDRQIAPTSGVGTSG